MKQIIISAMLLTAPLSYSQTYTSSFEPRSMNYYMAKAQVKGEEINIKVEILGNAVSEALKANTDYQFKKDMTDILPYLNLLLGDTPMSVIEAEGYYNQANKMYDEAVKNYYKRLNRR